MRLVYFVNGGLWFVQSWAWVKYSDSWLLAVAAIAIGTACMAYARKLDTYTWR